MSTQPNQQAPMQGRVVYVEARPAGHGLAVAALVCGIVGVVVGLIPLLFVAAWALGLVGLVLGAVACVRLGRQRVPRTMAVYAMVLGVAAFSLGVVGAVVVNNATNKLNHDLNTCCTSGTVPVYTTP